MAKDVDLEAIRSAVEQRLAQVALQATANNKASALEAKRTLELVDRLYASQAAERHASRMREVEKDPVALCEYLGELGEAQSEVQRVIQRRFGRKQLSASESQAWQAGAERLRWLRSAVQVDALRRGGSV